jgi:hypothetical protein
MPRSFHATTVNALVDVLVLDEPVLSVEEELLRRVEVVVVIEAAV